MVLMASLSRVTQYEAAKDRYFHLTTPSVTVPPMLPAVLSLSSFLTYFFPNYWALCWSSSATRKVGGGGGGGILVVKVDQSVKRL